MRHLFLVSFLLLTSLAWGNIHFIDIHRITKDEKQLLVFNDIKEKSIYCDHFSFEWNYEISMDELVSTLKSAYALFSTNSAKNEENQLLLGTLSHYLYNLDITEFHKKAITHFQQAQKLKKSDYRAYWFLGVHYSSSTWVQAGINEFEKAEPFLPNPVSADFWESYAYASSLAAMPSHTCYAMEKSKAITGRPGNFEQTLGPFNRGLIKPTPLSATLSEKELWKGDWADSLVITSRPLGVQVKVDTTWGIQPYPYENNASALLLFPPKLVGPKGDSISYTIAMIINTNKSYTSVEEFAKIFTQDQKGKIKPIRLEKKYKNCVAYEINDPSTYAHMGGARYYMYAVERDMPAFPGMALETKSDVEMTSGGEISYFTPTEVQNRVEGKIYYLFLLDTCNDIHNKSYANFLQLIKKDLIIE